MSNHAIGCRKNAHRKKSTASTIRLTLHVLEASQPQSLCIETNRNAKARAQLRTISLHEDRLLEAILQQRESNACPNGVPERVQSRLAVAVRPFAQDIQDFFCTPLVVLQYISGGC